VQIHGDAPSRRASRTADQERMQHLVGVMQPGHTVLVMADTNEPRIVERIECTKRHVRLLCGVAGIVDQAVRDQARNRDRQLPFVPQVVDRTMHDLGGAAARDLRVGANVGDHQLGRPQVRGHGATDPAGQVRREQARVLRAGGIDDEIGGGQLLEEARVRARAARVTCDEREDRRAIARLQPRPFLFGGCVIDQKDVVNPIAPARIDDLLLACQQPPVAVERDEQRVRSVGDVFNDADGQAQERAIVIDRGVERAPGAQEAAGKHDVANAAVGKVEGTTGPHQLVLKPLDPVGDGRARRRPKTRPERVNAT
jgi:hypothetical protein